MTDIDFYQVVEIQSSPATERLGVDSTHGVVVGISAGETERTYAVLVGQQTFMISPSDLVPTGESVTREAIYSGERVEVAPEKYSSRSDEDE